MIALRDSATRPHSQAVRSAEGAALLRAFGHRDLGVRIPDPYAEVFLGWKYRIALALASRQPQRFRRKLETRTPGLLPFFFARTYFFDDALRRALAMGIKQLVILGAGFDSRAYRFRELLEGVRVFELDFPGTQSLKKSRLNRHFGGLPAHVVYAPIDFNRESLGAVLDAHGYDRLLRTAFLWEGVTYYLPDHAVLQILDFVREGAAAGSSIAFDYALRSFIEGDLSFHGAAELKRQWADIGEPGLSGFPDGRTARFFAERGFEVWTDEGPEALRARYGGGEMLGCLRMTQVATPRT